jgi:tetratricopeptide (TPR) repeat protein
MFALRQAKKGNQANGNPGQPATKARYARRLVLLLAIFAALLLIFAVSGGVPRVLNRFAEAEIADRNFPEAKRWLELSSRLGPKQPATQFLLARIARHEGDAASMAEHLKTAGRLGFDRERLRLEEMLGMAQSGRLSDVEAELTSRLGQGDVDAAEICDAYANGLARESRFDEAIAILQAWRDDRPQDAVPSYRIARIQEHMHKLEDAKANYQKAVENNPEYYPAIYSLARIFLDENKATEAAEYFRKCLAMPNPLAAKTGLALSLVKLGEIEPAKKLLEEVVASDRALARDSYAALNESSERNVAACELGKLYQSEGKLEEALAMLDVALKDNSRDLTARYTRALVLKGLGREDEANTDFAIVSETKSAMERVNVLRNKINRDQDDIQSRLELGKLLIEYESERNGLFWLRSALQIDSDNIDVHRALAEFYEAHADQSAEYRQLARVHRHEVERLEAQSQ